MAVVIAVRLADWKLFTIKEDVGRSHVIRKIADIHFCRDKLHGNIITDFIDGNGGILADLARDAVVKTVIEPLSGLRLSGMIHGVLIALQRDCVNASVKGGVVGTHVVFEHSVEL